MANITPTGEPECRLGYNPIVWQKFHILGRVQVFVVSSVCAAVISSPLALASMGRYGRPFLGWPHEFDPLINFGLVFVSALPVFLGYYHLGRIGALLTVAVSAVMYFAARLCASLLFVFFYQALVFDAIAYLSTCLLLSMPVFAAHMKSSDSRAIRDAQRSLRLVRDTQIS
jgi:hypothetical protein